MLVVIPSFRIYLWQQVESPTVFKFCSTSKRLITWVCSLRTAGWSYTITSLGSFFLKTLNFVFNNFRIHYFTIICTQLQMHDWILEVESFSGQNFCTRTEVIDVLNNFVFFSYRKFIRRPLNLHFSASVHASDLLQIIEGDGQLTLDWGDYRISDK